MAMFEITQALMSVSTLFHARAQGADDVVYTVRGDLVSPVPRFALIKGEEGDKVAALAGNFVKTKFDIEVGGAVAATLTFPPVAFKKKFTLRVGDTEYAVDGGIFQGLFQCKGGTGEVDLEIAKQFGIRDSFIVKTTDKVADAIGLLATVAIHSRFYEMV